MASITTNRNGDMLNTEKLGIIIDFQRSLDAAKVVYFDQYSKYKGKKQVNPGNFWYY